MKGLYEWIRNLVGFLVFMSMILNLLPDRSYEKYIRLFAGTVLILLVFGPLTKDGELEMQMARVFERITFQNDVSLLRREMEDLDGRQTHRLIEAYMEIAEENVRRLVLEQDLECRSVNIEFDQTIKSENFGGILNMEIRLIAAAPDEWEQRAEINRRIPILKRKIGEYYGLEEHDIAVVLETGEG